VVILSGKKIFPRLKICSENMQIFFVDKYNARPHYGKIHELNKERMKKIYPHYDDFLKIKRELDPSNKFGNYFY